MIEVILTANGLNGGLYHLVVKEGIDDKSSCSLCDCSDKKGHSIMNECSEHKIIDQSTGHDCAMVRGAFWKKIIED